MPDPYIIGDRIKALLIEKVEVRCSETIKVALGRNGTSWQDEGTFKPVMQQIVDAVAEAVDEVLQDLEIPRGVWDAILELWASDTEIREHLTEIVTRHNDLVSAIRSSDSWEDFKSHFRSQPELTPIEPKRGPSK